MTRGRRKTRTNNQINPLWNPLRTWISKRTSKIIFCWTVISNPTFRKSQKRIWRFLKGSRRLSARFKTIYRACLNLRQVEDWGGRDFFKNCYWAPSKTWSRDVMCKDARVIDSKLHLDLLLLTLDWTWICHELIDWWRKHHIKSFEFERSWDFNPFYENSWSAWRRYIFCLKQGKCFKVCAWLWRKAWL